jgi:hypothetical protein
MVTMAIVTFGDWIMFKHGEVCLAEEAHLFVKEEYTHPLKVFRFEDGESYVDWEPRSSQNWFKYAIEFRKYKDDVHSIHTVCTDVRGQTRMLTIWISSKKRLADAHELIFQNKIIPVWEKLIGFLKECTTA